MMMREIVPEQKIGREKGRSMIDRLQNVLPYLEHLPPEAQEEAATYIAALTEALEFESPMLDRKRLAPQQIELMASWEDPADAWHDLPDTLLEDLDHLRHSSPSRDL